MRKTGACSHVTDEFAKLCPDCGNPVSYYEKKKQPVQPASKKEARSHTMLLLSVIVLGGLLIASLAFAIMLWSTSTSASPKREESHGSLNYGTLQVGTTVVSYPFRVKMICSCETTDLLAHCVAQEHITSFLKGYYR